MMNQLRITNCQLQGSMGQWLIVHYLRNSFRFLNVSLSLLCFNLRDQKSNILRLYFRFCYQKNNFLRLWLNFLSLKKSLCVLYSCFRYLKNSFYRLCFSFRYLRNSFLPSRDNLRALITGYCGLITMNNCLHAKDSRLRATDSRLLTIIFLLTITSLAHGQQNIVTAQYLYNGLLINPAYAGSHVQLSATLTYRNQWVNFEGAPVTATLGVHSSFYKGKVGLGALVTSDRIGSYTNTGAFASYAYIIQTASGGSFSMGVQLGANNYKADFSALKLRSAADPSFVNNSEIKPNVGTGIFYYDKKKFFGLSVPGLISYDKFFNNSLQPLYIPRYYYLNAGVKLRVNPRSDKVMLTPSVLVRIQDGTPVSMDFNLNLIFDEQVSIGTSYRTGDGITTFANLRITDKLSVGYFYDWITSDVRSYSRGSHELMINFRTRIKKVHKDLDCPHLFSH